MLECGPLVAHTVDLLFTLFQADEHSENCFLVTESEISSMGGVLWACL